MKFGPVVQQEMSFKDISYLELWQPLCSVDWNHLCNFGRMHHEEQSCEIILNLDHWFKRKCRLKVFLIWSSGSSSVQQSLTICAILVECIIRNNYLNNFEFGSVVQEEMSFKRFLIWSSGGPPVLWSGTIYAILKEGIMGSIHVKLYEIWISGSGGDVI